MARWPSGKAEACKAFIPGSNPGLASSELTTPASAGVSFLSRASSAALAEALDCEPEKCIMSEYIRSDMMRKTGKSFRLGALFRQIVQTWRENQAP